MANLGGSVVAIDSKLSAARSYLYVPATHRDRLDKAASRGADAIIADLEDSVAPADKSPARQTLAAWLDAQPQESACQLWARINADSVSEDIGLVVHHALSGVVVPKADCSLIDQVDALLSKNEDRLGLPHCSIRIIALIETARGLLDAAQMATAARIHRLGMGEADLIGELGLQPGLDREELMALRLQVVVASAAARIAPPVGSTSTDFRDLEAFRRTTERLLSLGFRGRTAIHPAQVPVLNDVFAPSNEEVARARALIEQFEHADSGVFTDEQGRMVDVAVIRSAREILARASAGNG
jgi:citrate lyase subunit beta/citryl-CoA lyase